MCGLYCKAQAVARRTRATPDNERTFTSAAAAGMPLTCRSSANADRAGRDLVKNCRTAAHGSRLVYGFASSIATNDRRWPNNQRGLRVTLTSRHHTCPETGRRKQARARNKAVLPLPDAPKIPTRSPPVKVRLIPVSSRCVTHKRSARSKVCGTCRSDINGQNASRRSKTCLPIKPTDGAG